MSCFARTNFCQRQGPYKRVLNSWLRTADCGDRMLATINEAKAMAQLAEIAINRVRIGVRRDEEAGVFVGFSPRFQVYSQGETKEDALEAVTSAIGLRLATAYEHGRIDKVLRQAGFEASALNGSSVLSPDDEFIQLTFTPDTEVTEVGIRVPLGALLQQEKMQCRH